jgi:hypothetical protein
MSALQKVVKSVVWGGGIIGLGVLLLEYTVPSPEQLEKVNSLHLSFLLPTKIHGLQPQQGINYLGGFIVINRKKLIVPLIRAWIGSPGSQKLSPNLQRDVHSANAQQSETSKLYQVIRENAQSDRPIWVCGMI